MAADDVEYPQCNFKKTGRQAYFCKIGNVHRITSVRDGNNVIRRVIGNLRSATAAKLGILPSTPQVAVQCTARLCCSPEPLKSQFSSQATLLHAFMLCSTCTVKPHTVLQISQFIFAVPFFLAGTYAEYYRIYFPLCCIKRLLTIHLGFT